MRKFDIFNGFTYPRNEVRFFKFEIAFTVPSKNKGKVEDWIKKYNLEEFCTPIVVDGLTYYSFDGGCRYDDADKFEGIVYELYTDYQKKLSLGYYLVDMITPSLNVDGDILPNCTDFHLFPRHS